MIKRFRIQNYKALRDVTLDVTPIHVLIGPNDTGKTSILEAFAALCLSVDYRLSEAFVGSWEGRQLVWQGGSDLPIELTASIEHAHTQFGYTLACTFQPEGRQVLIESEHVQFHEPESIGNEGNNASTVYNVVHRGVTVSNDLQKKVGLVHDSLAGVHAYRWDPRFLALPVAPDASRKFRMEPSGFGLALCLDDILGYDRNSFIALENRFVELFPHIESIKLIAQRAYKSAVDDPEQIPMLERSDGKGIYFELTGGGDPIPAQQASDGVLLVLAYLTVLHLPKPPRVLLIEEPENGIHPNRLKDVLSMLRGLVAEQQRTQVVLTSHSPYVVDLFTPDEVTLCQMQDDGSVSVHRLSESKTVREQLDVFTLGEIWAAEGDEALVQPTAAAGEQAG